MIFDKKEMILDNNSMHSLQYIKVVCINKHQQTAGLKHMDLIILNSLQHIMVM